MVVVWVSVAVLALLSMSCLLVFFLAGWRQNFGIWVTVSGIIASVFLQLFPSILIQNFSNAEIVGGGFTLLLVVGFTLCFPFVPPTKAREIAKKTAQAKYPSLQTHVGEAKLDNWTWQVNGHFSTSQGFAPFRVDVHAKCGNVIREHYT